MQNLPLESEGAELLEVTSHEFVWHFLSFMEGNERAVYCNKKLAIIIGHLPQERAKLADT